MIDDASQFILKASRLFVYLECKAGQILGKTLSEELCLRQGKKRISVCS